MEQEQSQEKSLFDINMDGNTQANILSVSKWGKFISVTGFIVCGLILILFAAYGEVIIKQVAAIFSMGQADLAGALIAVVVIGLILVVCWIYFLFRSSGLLREGLQSHDSAKLAEGFKAMRIYFIFSFIISLLGILSNLISLV